MGCHYWEADVPGVREIVVNGVNGLLFVKGDCQDIARKIEKYMHDQNLDSQLAKPAVN